MAVNVLKLKRDAVTLGMSRDAAIAADRKTLEDFIALMEKGAKESNGDAPAKKKAKTKPAPAAKKKAKKKISTETTPVGKKKTKAPAETKSEKSGKAKRPSAPKKTTRRKPVANADTNGFGRLPIGALDYTIESDEWNPVKGGPVERLFRALKKSKGDIDKAYEIVKGKPHDFVGKKKRNGEKRTKEEIEDMLRYRLNRTKYDFAKRTGQHESSTERVEYGTGQYATTRKKDKRKGPRKKAEAQPERKQNRKTTKKKATTTGKRRGRPPGSKNKPKEVATVAKRKPGQKKKK